MFFVFFWKMDSSAVKEDDVGSSAVKEDDVKKEAGETTINGINVISRDSYSFGLQLMDCCSL